MTPGHCNDHKLYVGCQAPELYCLTTGNAVMILGAKNGCKLLFFPQCRKFERSLNEKVVSQGLPV